MIALSTATKNALLVTWPLRTIFSGGYLWLYDGTRPVDPDLDVSGALIAAITNDGLYPNRSSNEFLRNGIGFEFVANNGVLSAELALGTWYVHVVTQGTPTWFRFTYWNDLPTGDDSTKMRMDGDIGDDLILTTDPLLIGSSETIAAFNVYF